MRDEETNHLLTTDRVRRRPNDVMQQAAVLLSARRKNVRGALHLSPLTSPSDLSYFRPLLCLSFKKLEFHKYRQNVEAI